MPDKKRDVVVPVISGVVVPPQVGVPISRMYEPPSARPRQGTGEGSRGAGKPARGGGGEAQRRHRGASRHRG